MKRQRLEAPSLIGANGRDSHGRFIRGNPGGPGNPFGQRVAQLRSALFLAVSAADLRALVRKLLQLAKGGDVQAAKVVLNRLLGPPVEVDILERLERLEAAVADGNQCVSTHGCIDHRTHARRE